MCQAIGSDVPLLRQCQRRFQCFKDGYDSLEDEEHQKRMNVMNKEALQIAAESYTSQTTR